MSSSQLRLTQTGVWLAPNNRCAVWLSHILPRVCLSVWAAQASHEPFVARRSKEHPQLCVTRTHTHTHPHTSSCQTQQRPAAACRWCAALPAQTQSARRDSPRPGPPHRTAAFARGEEGDAGACASTCEQILPEQQHLQICTAAAAAAAAAAAVSVRRGGGERGVRTDRTGQGQARYEMHGPRGSHHTSATDQTVTGSGLERSGTLEKTCLTRALCPSRPSHTHDRWVGPVRSTVDDCWQCTGVCEEERDVGEAGGGGAEAHWAA